jgi:DTW domain-containing protein YfiP
MIKAANTAKYHLRAEHTEEGMATLQAIAHAMGVIEGDHVKETLLKLYNLKLERTLLGRGIIPE